MDQATLTDWAETLELFEELWPALNLNDVQREIWAPRLRPLNQGWLREAAKLVYSEKASKEPKLNWLLDAFKRVRAEKGEKVSRAQLSARKIEEEAGQIDYENEEILRDLLSLSPDEINSALQSAMPKVILMEGYVGPGHTTLRLSLANRVLGKLSHDPKDWSRMLCGMVWASDKKLKGGNGGALQEHAQPQAGVGFISGDTRHPPRLPY